MKKSINIKKIFQTIYPFVVLFFFAVLMISANHGYGTSAALEKTNPPTSLDDSNRLERFCLASPPFRIGQDF